MPLSGMHTQYVLWSDEDTQGANWLGLGIGREMVRVRVKISVRANHRQSRGGSS